MPRVIPLEIIDYQVPADVYVFESWESPQFSQNPAYDDVVIRGRSEPHSFYSHTDAGVWQFTLHIMASISQGDGGKPLSVKEKENFIRSFIYPDYGDSAGKLAVVKSPHLARIRILKMLDAVGTIRNFSKTLLPPYDTVTGYPHQVDVSFSFQEQRTIDQKPLGYSEIRRSLAQGQDRQS